MLLRIQQGKGKKDRYAMLSATTTSFRISAHVVVPQAAHLGAHKTR